MSEEPRSALAGDERRLAAIVFTDVVGYSARIQRDEIRTLALVKADFAIMRAMCAQHGGELLNSMGDGLLLCFSSAVQAVACALQMQAEFGRRRAKLPPEQALEHRVGVHIGDVFRQEAGGVAGDGVNIAARLQTKAPPGGICISQTVHDTVKGKVPMQAVFIGPEAFKNIAEPIPIWHVAPTGGPTLTRPPRLAKQAGRKFPGWAVALPVVACVGIGVALVFQFGPMRSESKAENKSTSTTAPLVTVQSAPESKSAIPSTLSGPPTKEKISNLPRGEQQKPTAETAPTRVVPALAVAPGNPSGTRPATDAPWENFLGMKFVPVPGTDVFFSIWDTRVQDYQAFADETHRDWPKPNFVQASTHPAVNVAWDDAKAFCNWLTKKEQAAGLLRPNQSYRLPTDAEWSVAVGLERESGKTPQEKRGKIKGVYPWGTQWPPPQGAGNYTGSLHVDIFNNTSPVGSFAANKYGLYDMGGNVWQWCEDYYDGKSGARVLRGVAFGSHVDSELLLSSQRFGWISGDRYDPSSNTHYEAIGFRCVVAETVPAAPESPAANK